MFQSAAYSDGVPGRAFRGDASATQAFGLRLSRGV
jgi:hypothetical protein